MPEFDIRKMPTGMTLVQAIAHLGLKDWKSKKPAFLRWPPDVFGFAAWLLRESGAYRLVVARHPDHHFSLRPRRDDKKAWSAQVRKIGRLWSNDVSIDPPKAVSDAFETIKKFIQQEPGTLVTEITGNNLWQPLHLMLAIADESCWCISQPAGLVPQSPYVEKNATNSPQKPAQFKASQLPLGVAALWQLAYFVELHEESEHRRLSERKTHQPTNLCRNIPSDRMIVLPKVHTPQAGLTIRSMSHHLALHSGPEITPVWTPTYRSVGESPGLFAPLSRTFNILVLPYPFVTRPTQFRPASIARSGGRHSGAPYFTFEHDPLSINAKQLEALVNNATRLAGTINGIVLPEAAMSTNSALELFGEHGVPLNMDFLVCGVSEPSTSEKMGVNEALVRIGSSRAFRQGKHHRWKLTGEQVRMYHASGSLNPDTSWWEAIDVGPRTLRFVELADTCVFTVLICEDLARPDPVGDLIRAVGPDLVIALLQDGPQLNARWPGRFAGVLADDPGSSVLTVTSLGMCKLARPMDKLDAPASRVIAMWRDPVGGVREISLPNDHHAAILTIVQTRRTEYSADVRDDDNTATTLSLGGVQTLAMPDRKLPISRIAPKR